MFYGKKQLFVEEAALPSVPNPPSFNLSAEQQLDLVDAYMEHVYPYFPIVGRHELVHYLDLPSPSEVSSEDGGLRISPLLVFAIFALSANHASLGFEFQSSCAEALFDEAQALAMHYLDSPRCSTVLALVLMAAYLERRSWRTVNGKSTKARMFAGMSYAMAQELSLHRDSPSLSSSTRHLRCKLFWSLFAFDRIMGTMHRCPLVFDERETNLSYPSEAEEPDREHTLRLLEFVEHVKLATCIGRIVKLHSSQQTEIPRDHWTRDRILSSLDSSLATWFLMLPPHMQYATQSLEQNRTSAFIYTLNIFFYWALIMLHGPYVAQETSTESPPLRICKHAANQIRLIVDDTKDGEEEGDGVESIFPSYPCLQVADAVYALKM